MATRTVATEPFLYSLGSLIDCREQLDWDARVRLEVTLPVGFPEERRAGVERYARAAVMAMADKVGRDE
jgi:hypothetical protein